MTKKEINDNYAAMIISDIVSRDMLIGAYKQLDKQVSKYAYLKKKYANSYNNQSNIEAFNSAIEKRNIIERELCVKLGLSKNQISAECKALPDEAVIYGKSIDMLLMTLKQNAFVIV